MNILYIGDVMGEVGLQVVEQVLPDFKGRADLVIAQAENVTDGKGVAPEDFNRLLSAGVNFCTGGNWTLANEAIYPQLDDPSEPIVRPANYPEGTPGLGYKYIQTPKGSVLVVSLLGQIVGRDADRAVDNPLQVIDTILAKETADKRVATVVNIHGDFSSEKFVIGYYLDGRASLVVGDHWHVPTADADILPKGTAHITDVGMCGSLDSSLGVKFESVVPRWRDGLQTRNMLETAGRRQFNAVLVDIDEQTGRARSIEQIRQII
ncbi:MAG: TIGR00282 family metallophosphoesterase [Candidatus Saccharimonadales bacterium]